MVWTLDSSPNPAARRSATPKATTTTTLTKSILLSLLAGTTLAAASQPPSPTWHAVVAPAARPGVAAAAAAAAAAAGPDTYNNEYNFYNGQHSHDGRQQQEKQQVQADESQKTAPGAYTPLVTPGPNDNDAQALQDQGFRQETYYTCLTRAGGQEHCGWHVPIVKANAAPAAVPGSATDGRIVMAALGGLAGLFVVGMM